LVTKNSAIWRLTDIFDENKNVFAKEKNKEMRLALGNGCQHNICVRGTEPVFDWSFQPDGLNEALINPYLSNSRKDANVWR
jgi:hypothetical protein